MYEFKAEVTGAQHVGVLRKCRRGMHATCGTECNTNTGTMRNTPSAIPYAPME